MPITIAELHQGLITHDKGVLRRGSHQPDSREYCALEFASIMRGRPFSDKPTDLPDLRSLNDARWSSDAVRTEHLLPVMAALWDWGTWTSARQVAWAERVVILTVNRLVAEVPHLPEAVRIQCRGAKTVGEARIAAYAANAAVNAAVNAAAYAAANAAYAAYAANVVNAAANAAANAANAAANAAYAAYAANVVNAAANAAANAAYAADSVLIRACQLWVEAVAQTEMGA